MSVPLHQYLAEELSVSEETAEELLDNVIRDIRARAHQDDGAHLPNFGTFEIEDGTLQFTPSAALERAVNHRFAGLSSVSVSSTSPAEEAKTEETEKTEEPEAEAGPAEDEEVAEEVTAEEGEWHPPEPSDEHHPLGPRPQPSFKDAEHTVLPPEEEEEPPGETAPEDTEDQPAAAASAEEPDEPAEAEEPVAADADEPEPEEMLDEDWTEEVASEELDVPTPVRKSRSDRTPEPASWRENTALQAAILFVVALLVVGGGWYLLSQPGLFTGGSSPEPPATTAEGPAASGNEARPPGEIIAGDNESSEEGAESKTASAETTATEPESGSAQPIAPAGIDRSAGGWTIVVASRAERAPADDLVSTYRERFSAENLPVDLLTGTANGQTRYRVGVGQFANRDAALETIQRYSDRLPEGAWTLRIREGM